MPMIETEDLIGTSPVDRLEFDGLVAPHLPELNAAAARLAPSPDEAEDLVQETLADAFKGVHRLRQRELLGAWLLQIVHRRGVDAIRRRIRERRLLGSVRSPSTAPVIRGESELVQLALQALAPDERRIVELRYFQSRSSAEIALLLGKPAGTVRSMLFRALQVVEAEIRRLDRQEES